MQQAIASSKKGFTLIELLIVVFVIGVIAMSIGYIDFNEVNNRKRAEIFTNDISRVFEDTRNSSLFWRSVNWVSPDAWRVIFNQTNSGTFVTEYLTSNTWQSYDSDQYTFQVDFPGYIWSISCNNTWDISSWTWSVVFRWSDVSFSGSCDESDKIMTLESNYSAYTWEVIINAISGVIETR